ncbi:MAG: ABC transporter ATP-binding protein [candidate division KSB1 bacterium]|nr:ABC transporter ATP-binding protein [candidate division KSB1 bacterium]MDZ7333801.1 ABC transporter ATP-binding protein [candidate division KSB1 bacterium]MDZ7356044.1 ABC transporter ATP-binding protein [candidate division KSB1 bacterium]MDZ7376982.1 ABC transporter ATP-binding protein [candidate division KSB1 bacterium]MDZ7400561.1 ABC transporter ATP-binding protein [candidate division KSB1 bacterium]
MRNLNRIVLTDNLYKNYYLDSRTIEVLKGIDLEIYEGEVVAIMGPSGVGKSTLLHILGVLDRPTKGRVLIDGIDIFQYNDQQLAAYRNRSVGFVFQFHHLLPEFSALENVMLPGLIAGLDKVLVRNRAIELLTEVGLEERLDHRPNELSGGEQQRVAVARALINSPKLLLADEPSGNLDRQAAESLHRLFWDLNHKLHQTLIIVTHNQELANQADRVIELFDGRVRFNKSKGDRS